MSGMKNIRVAFLILMLTALSFALAGQPPSLEKRVEDYQKGNDVLIYGLKNSAGNPEIDKFNKAVDSTVMDFYISCQSYAEDFPDRNAKAVIKSFPWQSQNWLQIIATYLMTPFNENHIVSFNYDIKSNRYVTLEEMLKRNDLDEKTIEEKVKKAYAGPGEVRAVKTKGFVVFEGNEDELRILLEVQIEYGFYLYAFAPTAEAHGGNPIQRLDKALLFDDPVHWDGDEGEGAKAYKIYGLFDPTSALDNFRRETGRVDPILARIHDEFGVSVFIVVTTPEQGRDLNDTAINFEKQHVSDWLDARKFSKGIILACENGKINYAVRRFDYRDFEAESESEMFRLYPNTFIDKTMQDSTLLGSMTDSYFEPIVRKLYERARIFYGQDKAGKLKQGGTRKCTKN